MVVYHYDGAVVQGGAWPLQTRLPSCLNNTETQISSIGTGRGIARTGWCPFAVAEARKGSALDPRDTVVGFVG